jgi:hypothetical protein
MRHQAHVTGAARKISELSQRVLQLHSSSLFIHHLHSGGGGGGGGGDHDEDLRYGDRSGGSSEDYYNGSSSSHFAPIVTLKENVSSPTGSMSSEDSESRNEFDSGIYEEAHDLRVNVTNNNNNNNNIISSSVGKNSMNLNMSLSNLLPERKTSETTTEELCKGGDDLVRLKLELQIDVLKLRKRKLEIEVRRLRRGPGLVWMRRKNNNIKKKMIS